MPRRRETAATIAARISEDVRALNYATLPGDGFPGLDWPADASDTIAAVAEAVARLPQALGQIADFLTTQKRRPGLADRFSRYAGRPREAVDAACTALRAAATETGRVQVRLAKAHNATAGLSIDDPGNR
jgi:hypothetical protein